MNHSSVVMARECVCVCVRACVRACVHVRSRGFVTSRRERISFILTCKRNALTTSVREKRDSDETEF
jgi:hypothetical protein